MPSRKVMGTKTAALVPAHQATPYPLSHIAPERTISPQIAGKLAKLPRQAVHGLRPTQSLSAIQSSKYDPCPDGV